MNERMNDEGDEGREGEEESACIAAARTAGT